MDRVESVANEAGPNPKTQIPKAKTGLFHAPFMDAGGEAFGQLDFQTQGSGFDWIEGGAIVFVFFATERGGIGNGFPIVFVAIEQLPGSGHAAFASAGIVEPIDFNCRDFGGFFEIVLNPFIGSFMRPPMEIPIGVIVRVFRFPLVVQRANIRVDSPIARSRCLAGRGDGGVRQRPGGRFGARKPNRHLAGATICPGKIRNRGERDVFLVDLVLLVNVTKAGGLAFDYFQGSMNFYCLFV